MKRAISSMVAFGLTLALAAPATAHERYDPQRAGHPLRIVAYAAHPVGYLLDRLIFYPAWVIGGWRPIGVLVGRDLPRPELEPDPQPEGPSQP